MQIFPQIFIQFAYEYLLSYNFVKPGAYFTKS